MKHHKYLDPKNIKSEESFIYDKVTILVKKKDNLRRSICDYYFKFIGVKLIYIKRKGGPFSVITKCKELDLNMVLEGDKVEFILLTPIGGTVPVNVKVRIDDVTYS